MDLKQFENKQVFIYAYNDYGLKLKSFFRKQKLKYNFKGFIDKKKELTIDLGYKIYKPNILKDEDFDFIVITSPNYYKEIYQELLNKHIPEKKILNGLVFIENEQDDIQINKVKQLKNKHENSRCFIIGNGPSLTIKDLESLNDEITFGANGLVLGLNNTSFRPNYYSICDNKSMEFFEDKIRNFFTEDTILVFPKKVLKSTCKIKNAIYYEDNHNNKIDFDLAEGIYTGTTVVYNLISIAIYMGLIEIYLIGLDFNYEFLDDTKSNHFISGYPEDKNKNTALNEIEIWIRDFKMLKNLLENKNIKIFNATRGGKLEIFPRVDFDQILKGI